MGIAAAAASIGSFLGISAATAGTAAAVGGTVAEGASLAGTFAGAALPSLAFSTAAEAASTIPAWLSVGSSVLSGVTGAIGSIEQGQAQAGAAKYAAQIAAGNARVAKENAAIAGQSGEQQAFMTGEKTRALVGSIKANQAASGIDVNRGSAVDVRSSAAELGELDALTVRSNATREAYGYSQQAASFTQQSILDTFEAKNAATAGYINAASTFLGSAGDAASNYYKYQLAGGFTG